MKALVAMLLLAGCSTPAPEGMSMEQWLKETGIPYIEVTLYTHRF
jgi:hypothetical protein